MVKVFEEKTAYFEALFENENLVWMGQNTNHYPVFGAIRDAMIESIESEEYHKYAPPMGISELRGLIAKDVEAPDATTWVTDGATEGLYQITHTLLKPGDGFVTTDPGYMITVNFAKHAGAMISEAPIYNKENSYKMTEEQLKERMNPNVKLVYLVDPNNPLGCVYTESEIRAFVDICEDYGALFVQDCTYRHFADKHFPALRYSLENALIVYSFSKFAGLAGLRVGGVIGDESIIEKLVQAQINNLGTNVVAQRAALAALKTKDQWFGNFLRMTREHAAIVKKTVDTIDGAYVTVYPSSTNFIAVDIKGTGVHPAQLCTYLLDNSDYFIRQAGYQSKLYADRFVKVSLSVPTDSIQKFVEYLPEALEKAKGVKTTRALY